MKRNAWLPLIAFAVAASFVVTPASGLFQEVQAYTSDTIKVGDDPKDVAVNPKTNMVYVANFDNVAVIDGATNSIVATIPIGNDTNGWAIEVNPETNKAYVLGHLANEVIVIDTMTNKVVTTIPVGNSPTGIAINTQTNTVYVANTYDSEKPDSISVIDGNTDKVTATIDVRPSQENNGLGATWPSGMTVDENRNFLYVGGMASSAIVVIDGLTNEILERIERDGDFRKIAVNPASGRVYAGNVQYSSVDVLIELEQDSGSNLRIVDSVMKGDDQSIVYPQAIDVNPNTNRVYVSAGDSSILVIDGESRQVLSSIGVGLVPLGIAVNPETNMIYVANFGSDSVSVIDGSTNNVILTLSSFMFEIIGGAAVAGAAGIIILARRRKREDNGR